MHLSEAGLDSKISIDEIILCVYRYYVLVSSLRRVSIWGSGRFWSIVPSSLKPASVKNVRNLNCLCLFTVLFVCVYISERERVCMCVMKKGVHVSVCVFVSVCVCVCIKKKGMCVFVCVYLCVCVFKRIMCHMMACLSDI